MSGKTQFVEIAVQIATMVSQCSVSLVSEVIVCGVDSLHHNEWCLQISHNNNYDKDTPCGGNKLPLGYKLIASGGNFT